MTQVASGLGAPGAVVTADLFGPARAACVRAVVSRAEVRITIAVAVMVTVTVTDLLAITVAILVTVSRTCVGGGAPLDHEVVSGGAGRPGRNWNRRNWRGPAERGLSTH